MEEKKVVGVEVEEAPVTEKVAPVETRAEVAGQTRTNDRRPRGDQRRSTPRQQTRW